MDHKFYRKKKTKKLNTTQQPEKRFWSDKGPTRIDWAKYWQMFKYFSQFASPEKDTFFFELHGLYLQHVTSFLRFFGLECSSTSKS